MNQPAIIYVADDHRLMADGFAKILNQLGYTDIRIFEDGLSLTKAIYSVKPSIVFLDINMPKQNGIETLKSFKESNLGIKFIMLTMIDEKSVLDECMSLGAKAILHKNSNVDEIAEAIKIVMQQKTYITPALEKLRQEKREIKNEEGHINLTEKEIEILQHLCNGDNPKEIAEKIFLSYRTVETHKKNIMHKFDVKSVAKLIALAYKYNLVKL